MRPPRARCCERSTSARASAARAHGRVYFPPLSHAFARSLSRRVETRLKEDALPDRKNHATPNAGSSA